MSKLFFSYINHKEEKYDNEDNNGILTRKHLMITGFAYIGKESNNLEVSNIVGVDDEDNVIYDDKITDNKTLTPKERSLIKRLSNIEARKIGISRTELYYLKRKIRRNKVITLKKKTFNRLGKFI